MSRHKKVIPEMMPVKKMLSQREACAYLDMSLTKFLNVVVSEGLSISIIGSTKYFRVVELDNLLEKNICKRQTA